MSKNLKKELSFRVLSLLTASVLLIQAIMVLGDSEAEAQAQAQAQAQEGSDRFSQNILEQVKTDRQAFDQYISQISEVSNISDDKIRELNGFLVIFSESTGSLSLYYVVDKVFSNSLVKRGYEVVWLWTEMRNTEGMIAQLLSERPVLPMDVAQEMVALFDNPENLNPGIVRDSIDSVPGTPGNNESKFQKIEFKTDNIKTDSPLHDLSTQGSRFGSYFDKNNEARILQENSKALKIVKELNSRRWELNLSAYNKFEEMLKKFSVFDLNDLKNHEKAHANVTEVEKLDRSRKDLFNQTQRLISGKNGIIEFSNRYRLVRVAGSLVMILIISDGIINYELVESLKRDPTFFPTFKLAKVSGIEAAEFLKKSSKDIGDELKKSKWLEQFLN